MVFGVAERPSRPGLRGEGGVTCRARKGEGRNREARPRACGLVLRWKVTLRTRVSVLSKHDNELWHTYRQGIHTHATDRRRVAPRRAPPGHHRTRRLPPGRCWGEFDWKMLRRPHVRSGWRKDWTWSKGVCAICTLLLRMLGKDASFKRGVAPFNAACEVAEAMQGSAANFQYRAA